MPFNGSGTFSLYTPGTPFVTGTTISSTVMNNVQSDVATNGLSKCITIDGQSTATARIGFAAGISVTTDLTTPSTTFNIANSTATTVNIGGGATVGVNVGNASGPIAFPGNITPAKLVDISGASAGQIKFPATQNASSDANTLDDYLETTFTGTFTGFTTSPTLTIYVTKVGNSANLTPGTSSTTATSNATTKTITGMPSAIRPTRDQPFFFAGLDNGGTIAMAFAKITSAGVISFFSSLIGGAWTASGSANITMPNVPYNQG